MSFSLPRFAKTNGRTQKPTDVGEERGSETPTSRSPSFLQSLKRRLSGRSMGSTNSFDADSTPLEDKSYFSKTSGTSTMARHINAFAWVRLLAGFSFTATYHALLQSFNCTASSTMCQQHLEI